MSMMLYAMCPFLGITPCPQISVESLLMAKSLLLLNGHFAPVLYNHVSAPLVTPCPPPPPPPPPTHTHTHTPTHFVCTMVHLVILFCPPLDASCTAVASPVLYRNVAPSYGRGNPPLLLYGHGFSLYDNGTPSLVWS